jgi:hypothetical protein
MTDLPIAPLERLSYSVAELAEATGLSDQAIYDAIARNDLAAKKVGKAGSKRPRVLIPVASAQAWIANLPDQ